MDAMSMSAPPARRPAWQLSRAAIGLWLTEGALGTLGAAAITTVFLLAAPASAGGPVPLLRWLIPIAAVGYALVAIGVRPWVRFAVHRWEVTSEAVYTLTGWLTRTWVLVPISRIQTVDVTRGVVQQLFGLATVSVLTASSAGTVRVLHLEHDVAQRVAADLAHRAEQVRDQAT
jgi:membrane protein YdbS with pleckstrin-like domain